MRNEALSGYLLHQRPYQEKRALYYLFSQEQGVVHGIGKKGAPLFELLHLFATGKRDLKTFSQIAMGQIETIDTDEVATIKNYSQISGQQQYAALYLNEILWKLLPTEDPMPTLWQHYQDSLLLLKQPLTAIELKLCLRDFEKHLFKELGFAISLTQDSNLENIEANTVYRFLPDTGFMPILVNSGADITPSSHTIFNGQEILLMQNRGIAEASLDLWSRLHKQLIDQLLDYQPLQSRLLWQQQQRYQ